MAAAGAKRNSVDHRNRLTYRAMIFTNGRVILADGIRDDLDLVVRDGKIAELRSRTVVIDAIDLRGNFLAPGFVDLHVHGAMGRDTMDGSADSLRTISRYHATGGTTSLLATTVTSEIEQIGSVLSVVRELRSQIPQIVGAHVEGPFISPEKPGAQNPRFICQPSPELVDRLFEHRDVIKRITIAPEIGGALKCIERFASVGVSMSGGHSNAWDEEARAGYERGMRSVTHTFNCMSSARRRGIDRVAGLLEFALSEPEISCELIADGHHVSSTLMKMLYRAKGSNRISLVTDATAGAGLPDGTKFELGGKRCLVSNGVCLLGDKSALAGSASSMMDLVRTMVSKVGIPLHEAIAMASRNPAREIALVGKGKIAAGNDADLIVISPGLEIEQTFLAGECVYSR
jgi:N-acetylglucosamine-6-phosphate deacetylase